MDVRVFVYLNAANDSLWVDDCHWGPQYEYFYDADGRKLCQHVIHFDNLRNEFDGLMQNIMWIECLIWMSDTR